MKRVTTDDISMFLEKSDLKNGIYGYQVDQITESDDTIVDQAIAAAIEEAKSYLTQNINNTDVYDGRIIYDVEAIFNAVDADRNALILQHCITLTKWHIVDLCNADILYEKAKERYDRAVKWFEKINNGKNTLKSLPQLEITDDNNEKQPFSFGSRTKFNHDY